MAKSLAEMRQSAATGLPERTKRLCLAQSLMSQAQSLTEERESLKVDAVADVAPDGPVKPKRMVENVDPRVKEIDAELELLWVEMREHTGELTLRGVTAGDWRRWTIAHPARVKDPDGQDVPGKAFDDAVSYGFCSADDLIADLGKYAAAWNGDPLGEGDWDFIVNRAAPGDLKECARLVVVMHEGEGVMAPKASPKPLSVTPLDATA